MQWWGIFVACSTVFGPAKDAGEADWGSATICGPVFLTVSSRFAFFHLAPLGCVV